MATNRSLRKNTQVIVSKEEKHAQTWGQWFWSIPRLFYTRPSSVKRGTPASHTSVAAQRVLRQPPRLANQSDGAFNLDDALNLLEQTMSAPMDGVDDMGIINQFNQARPTKEFREEMIQCLDQYIYIKPFGICFFRLPCAHHHNDRAKAVKRAIRMSLTMGEIESIYMNQLNLFRAAVGMDQLSNVPPLQQDLRETLGRFSDPRQLRNRPRDRRTLEKSGYIKALQEIKRKCEEKRSQYMTMLVTAPRLV